MQIKELESAIELPSSTGEGRNGPLTTAGEYFLVYAKRLLAISWWGCDGRRRRDGPAALRVFRSRPGSRWAW